MNKKISSSTDTSGRIKRSFWQWLVGPNEIITNHSERRQAAVVSALLLVLTLTMTSGVLYMRFSSTPIVSFVLGGAQIIMAMAYVLSRTRFYRWAAPLCLVVLSIIPILNVTLGNDHTPKTLTLLLIWNTLTILLGSAMVSLRLTALFVAIDIVTLLLFPVLIPTVLLTNILFPLIFNSVISITILVFTLHRNLMEKDRLIEMARINEKLELELAERKRIEEKLTYTALHDPLTDLPNRVLFMDRLHHAMEHARRHKNFTFAVFFIDLDRFKVVNDSLGHYVGDSLIIESAHRLVECVRTEDTVARLGGDEFVILLENMEGSLDYIQVANRILNKLALPANLADHKVFVSASIGIVFAGAQYTQAEDLLRDADIAMYHAKGLGRGRYEVFDPAMLEHVIVSRQLELDLRKALRDHEFIVHYQPIMDIKNHRITGFEALVRWLHPTKGLFQPAEFIPIAEETALIVPLGYWVLDEACRQIHAWQKQFPVDPPLTVNVNLSTRQCAEKDLVEKIVEILQKYKLDAGSLKLEITESLIVKDTRYISSMLSRLRELGIQVQIDDFGTGYSSLGYLHTLPIDTLKIDRTFISRLGSNDNGSEIVRTILALAHNLGMKVIAEGVETQDQFTALEAMDCEYVQGFFFARPVDSQTASGLLEHSLSGEEDWGGKL